MNNKLSVIILILLLSACGKDTPLPPVEDAETRRAAPAGKVVGFAAENGSHVWQGLPYAQAPQGGLRWRAPRPLNAWQGEKQALSFGPECAQPVSQLSGEVNEGNVTGQEDCLYLDIYAPPMSAEETAQANLPVMFWIHGGGNTIGTTRSYDASVLAQRENVIVITAQYRLGPFGWFYQPELFTEGDSAVDKSGNYGTLDLIAALNWTKNNIQAFGGNSNNVTIFGESAGGFNVISLMISPLAKGLFHKAISQSGSANFASLVRATEGEHNSSYQATQRLIELSGKGSVKALKNLNPDQILSAYESGGSSGMIRMPTIFHDGYTIPEQSTLELMAAGNYNQVPAILGTNKDEQKLFQYLDPKYTDTWFGIWSRPRDRKVYARDASYQTDHWRLIGVEEPARAMTQSPVYAYRFDWDDLGSPLGMDFSFLFGAAHAFEIPFVFGGVGLGPLGQILDSTPNPEERIEIENAMMRYWANFARSGNPNGEKGELPIWQAWGENGQEQSLTIDASSDGGIRMSDQTLSVQSTIKRLKDDPDFANQAERCALLDTMLSRSSLFKSAAEQIDCG